MKERIRLSVVVLLLVTACLLATKLLYPKDDSTSHGPHAPTTTSTTATASTNANYQLTAWGELGMHCIDGKDYSVFAVLPPYNSIPGQPGQLGSTPVVNNRAG